MQVRFRFEFPKRRNGVGVRLIFFLNESYKTLGTFGTKYAGPLACSWPSGMLATWFAARAEAQLRVGLVQKSFFGKNSLAIQAIQHELVRTDADQVHAPLCLSVSLSLAAAVPVCRPELRQ